MFVFIIPELSLSLYLIGLHIVHNSLIIGKGQIKKMSFNWPAKHKANVCNTIIWMDGGTDRWTWESRKALADCFSPIQAAMSVSTWCGTRVNAHLVYFTAILISIIITESRVNVNVIVTRSSFFFNLTGFPEAEECQCGLSSCLLGFCLR